jgi:osmotically inducible protein OsmC
MKILFSERATTKGGRNGHGETEDGKVKADFSLPKTMGGAGGEGITPEHLFALGYSACFGSALQFVGGREKKDVSDLAVTAQVGIGRGESGGFGFEITLEVSLPKVTREEAEALVAAAHQVCPYSNAIKGNVPVELKVA